MAWNRPGHCTAGGPDLAPGWFCPARKLKDKLHFFTDEVFFLNWVKLSEITLILKHV